MGSRLHDGLCVDDDGRVYRVLPLEAVGFIERGRQPSAAEAKASERGAYMSPTAWRRFRSGLDAFPSPASPGQRTLLERRQVKAAEQAAIRAAHKTGKRGFFSQRVAGWSGVIRRSVFGVAPRVFRDEGLQARRNAKRDEPPSTSPHKELATAFATDLT